MNRLIAAVLISAVVLTGCSATADVEESLTPLAKASATPTPTPEPAVEQILYVDTDPIDWEINPAYVEGTPCERDGFSWQFLGLSEAGDPAYLRCTSRNGKFVYSVDPRMPLIDPSTRKPLIPVEVPQSTLFGYSPNTYIDPTVDETEPKSELTVGDYSNYAQCKVSEGGDGSPDKSYGFPLPRIRAVLDDDFQILVVPVQFDDHQTRNRPAEDLADVISALSNFYQRAASVEVNLNWTIPDSYYQMGRPIADFDLGIEFDPTFQTDFWRNYRKYIQAAINLADDEYDFSQFDAVIVEEPRTVSDAEHGMFIPHAPASAGGSDAIYSDEGQVLNLLVTGNDELRDIPNWIHEFGHLLGLGDRNWNTDATPGFDLMFGWYGSPELSAWNRWLLGILKDEQVDCKTDVETSTHLVQPVAWIGHYKKAVVIPISEFEVLVVESRRRQGFDALFGKESEGAYVYRIDTSAKMYQPDSKVIVDVVAPARSRPTMSWSMDASLKLGESVTSDGWTIKVIETGGFGDVIQVSKKG